MEVLAVVEAKRIFNDLGHGFRRRQEDLAWLTGESDRYDPEAYRTRRFPSGHFDRAVVHWENGGEFLFCRRSFRLFRHEPGPGLILSRLYFITRSGPAWGISSSNLACVGHRHATDERWAPGSDAYLRALLRWCRSLTDSIETPEVLEVYAAARRQARQTVVICPAGSERRPAP